MVRVVQFMSPNLVFSNYLACSMQRFIRVELPQALVFYSQKVGIKLFYQNLFQKFTFIGENLFLPSRKRLIQEIQSLRSDLKTPLMPLVNLPSKKLH